jgi:hypothetical protein
MISIVHYTLADIIEYQIDSHATEKPTTHTYDTYATGKPTPTKASAIRK